MDSHGNYIKEAKQDDTYPYLAFTLDAFDDESAQQLLLREDSDEFAVVMHVRPPLSRSSDTAWYCSCSHLGLLLCVLRTLSMVRQLRKSEPSRSTATRTASQSVQSHCKRFKHRSTITAILAGTLCSLTACYLTLLGRFMLVFRSRESPSETCALYKYV